MSGSRRHGNPTGFWSNVAVGVGGLSNKQEVGRDVGDFAVYMTVSGATTLEVLAAHSGPLTAEGLEADGTPVDANFFPLYYISGSTGVTGNKVEFTFAGAGSAILMVPDFLPNWIRLRSTAAATITAGWEAQGA